VCVRPYTFGVINKYGRIRDFVQWKVGVPDAWRVEVLSLRVLLSPVFLTLYFRTLITPHPHFWYTLSPKCEDIIRQDIFQV